MEELKSHDQIDQPETIARARFRSVQQLHAIAESIQLCETVPDDVQRQFNIARHAFIYSWYYHNFNAVAELYSFLAIERALYHRVKPVRPNMFRDDREPTLYPLLLIAIQERWLVDGSFDVQLPSDFVMPLKIAARFREIPSDQRYCYALLDWLPELRNDVAHGKFAVVPGVSHSLARAAELINQLYS